MPTIPLPKKKIWSDYKRYAKRQYRDDSNFNIIYNTKTWKELRLEKLRHDPLCEKCQAEGRLASAIDVHHIIEISNGKTIFEKQALGFDYNNLMSLCKECHKKIHK